MLEKITEQEIEFMELWHYPPALVECLFSNFDNLAEFDEDKFSTLRQYQIPMISFEPIIDEDPSKTEQENFNMKKNVGDVYNFCARKVGKCEYINNECTLANGKIIKFKDLIGKTEEVISLNEDTWKLEKDIAHFSDNGIKNCYKLITTSGKEIIVTENHPFLTSEGWKQINELSTQDFIATSIYSEPKNKKALDKYEIAKLIGSYIVWEKIKEITDSGLLLTVAVSVPKNKNYISNNIISHNTQCSEKIDIPVSMLHNPGWICGFSSADAGKITAVLDPVKRAIDFHPILKGFKRRTRTHPHYQLEAKNGWTLLGINQNLKGKCVDDKTEILTNEGWKNIDNIDKNQKALSLNPKNNKAGFYKIKNIYKYPNYRGEIYETGGFSKFVFTPEHNIYYNWNSKQNWQFKPIKTLNLNRNGYIAFKQNFDWEGKENNTPMIFNIRENNKYYKLKEINFDDWLEFLGWFISEGSLVEEKNGSYKVVISQHQSENPEHFKNIGYLLKRMGVNYYTSSTYLIFKNKEIFDHLKNNCYSGDYIKRKSKCNSHTKTIPEYIKNLSKRQIRIFLNSYFSGDGSFKNGDFTSCCSCSKQLSDNIQILLLKLGYSTSYRYSKRDGCHHINILISKISSISQRKIKRKQYKGRVWCVEVEPFNLIFIRRRGRCCWTGNSPGSQFVGKHFKKLWLEENSYETEEIFKLRKESLSEVGAILRQSGMTNFTKQMPAGRVFYDIENKNKVINLPQFVSPYWSDKEREDRIKEYGGIESPSYRIFVEGEVIEDGVSEFDMERVQACYNNKTTIKRFELKKDDFSRFKNLIITERPKNADRIFICADIGDGAGGSDIIVVSEVGDKYIFLYNIILYNYTEEEQEEVFDWLIQSLQANIIACDNGDGTGRGLYHRMVKKYPLENLVRYFGNKKVTVGYEKDEKGNIAMKNGLPVCLEEFMSEWSVRRLKTLLYEGRFTIPRDAKFDNQINSVISTRSGTRTLYGCTSTTGDHLFDAWKVFAIAQWLCKDFNATPSLFQNWGCGACSWIKKESKQLEER